MSIIFTSSYTTKVGGARVKGTRSEVLVSNYYNMLTSLRTVDKELLKEFRKNARSIGKPVQQAIRNAIPGTPPIPGMRRRVVPGRVTWGVGKPAKSALIRLKNPRKFQVGERTAILSVRVASPATVIADMAGKGTVVGRAKITPVYAYSRAKSGFRTHRINGQGDAMIRALSVSGGASRFVWKGAESALPEARAEFKNAVDDAVYTINRELERVNGV